MKENKHLSERLPVHSPDDSLWSSISAGLDALENEKAYRERLAGLPTHRPDDALWSAILGRMRRPVYIRMVAYSVLAVAASLLLLVTVLRQPEVPADLRHEQQTAVATNPKPSNTRPGQSAGIRTIVPVPEKRIAQSGKVRSRQQEEELISATITDIPASAGSVLATNIPVITPAIARTNIPVNLKNRFTRKVPKNRNPAPLYALVPAVLPNSDPYEQETKGFRKVTLAANYLPESLENGSGSSMFHNFGLMASLGNEKTRIQSSIGMAYNSEHRVYDVDYTQFIPITVPIPGTGKDSTAIMEASGASQLEGTERHQYFTYDLGMGKRLFSVGKMTTWLNTGAGLAVKLDDASLKETTIKTINQHNNSQVNRIDLEIPDYNGLNINLMAGLDFNYRIMDRLSLSFAPTSRYYIRPVLEKNGASTDSFSFGFRSGMKFEF